MIINRRGCWIVVLVGLLATAVGQADQETVEGSAGTYGESFQEINFESLVEVEVMPEWVRRWQEDCPRTASYLKASVLDYLLERIDKNQPVTFRRAAPEPDATRHQLTIVGGRAAYMIEHVVGVELPVVNERSLKESATTIKAEACRVVEAYRNGVMQAGREYGSPGAERLAQLKATYHGKLEIGHSAKDPFGSAERFARLLSEWFPLGKRMEELEEIVGHPGQRSAPGVRPETRSFVFFGGVTGLLYTFELRDGVIERVFVNRAH